MADFDPRYPCSSIEDDFNYGSCVASASVHIRMGTSPGPSRPRLVGPLASPASGGWFPASEASILRDQALGIPPISWVQRTAFPPPSGPLAGKKGFLPPQGLRGRGEVAPQLYAQRPETESILSSSVEKGLKTSLA